MRIVKLVIGAMVVILAVFCLVGQASADIGKLIGLLMNNLDVTEKQATGGAGAVFKEAKSNMSSTDYSQLLEALPGIGTLIQSAPESSSAEGGDLTEKGASMLGGSSGLGSSAESMAGTAGLASTFSKLGLSPDMTGKFIDQILNFVQSEAGQQTMTLLKNALL